MAPAFTIGWVYNLSSVPEDSGASTIVAVAVAFSILSLFACALRLYCKLVFMRGYSAVSYWVPRTVPIPYTVRLQWINSEEKIP
ncbi:hypothetical protein D0864_09366 [Hortaea werneckii]|uniref:Uncharacterized protein n=1 Tax=Hortaea werneckii TaxID=91943 RepID=A0A3M7EMX7_HORWE|nr:hypothetical protein D0864_09366 [Hortaea werneckii]